MTSCVLGQLASLFSLYESYRVMTRYAMLTSPQYDFEYRVRCSFARVWRSDILDRAAGRSTSGPVHGDFSAQAKTSYILVV